MAFDVKQWIADVQSQHPDLVIPDEARNGWLRQSDYDKNWYKLKKEHESRMAVEDEFHNDLLTDKQKLDLVKDLEGKFGPAENWTPALASAISTQHPGLGNPTSGNGKPNVAIDDIQKLIQDAIAPLKEDYSRQIQNIGTGAAVMIDFMTEAPEMWKEKYGTRFPKNEFSKFFNESGTSNPRLAYELFEKPFLAKKIETDTAAALEAAERKGYQSAMSKHGIAESSASARTNPFEGNLDMDPATGRVREESTDVTRDQSRSKVGQAFAKALDRAERGEVNTTGP